jgi:hypothetical protein
MASAAPTSPAIMDLAGTARLRFLGEMRDQALEAAAGILSRTQIAGCDAEELAGVV